MKIAVVQPYFFPYQGYFDLMRKVDLFVYLTDVQYIRRGWINRNKIQSNGRDTFLTVPVRKVSREVKIKDILINNDENWHAKHCQIIEHEFGQKALNNQLYSKYKDMHPEDNLCNFVCKTLEMIIDYLGIKTKTTRSDFFKKVSIKSESSAENTILSICKTLGATEYINPYGGRDLYNEFVFSRHGIKLDFMPEPTYKNMNSILDVILR